MYWSENAGEITKCPHKDNHFYWEVPNFFSFQSSLNLFEQVDPRIVSCPWFFAFNRKWRLSLILNAKRGEHGYVGFFLWIMSSSLEIPNVKVQLIATDVNGEEYRSCNGDVDLNGRFGSWEFLRLSALSTEKSKLAPAGVLKLLCIMEETVPVILDFPGGSECSEKKDAKPDEIATSEDLVKTEVPETKGVDRLLQNLKNIFLEEQGSDAILKVEDRDFKVHKTILIARSPIFASMFKHDTKENTTGTVDIPDCSAAAFEAFLLFLYTASTDTMSQDNVFDLYYAADKYQVNDLKSECIEYMANNLSAENFCAVMTLSLKHSESGLQEKAIDFFCGNFKTIIKTVQWQRYLRDYPTEANELYIKAVNA